MQADPGAELVARRRPGRRPGGSGRGGPTARRAYPTIASMVARSAAPTSSACASRRRSTCRSCARPPRPACSVLLEKPMADLVADVRRDRGACRAAGVTLMLGLTHRFHRGADRGPRADRRRRDRRSRCSPTTSSRFGEHAALAGLVLRPAAVGRRRADARRRPPRRPDGLARRQPDRRGLRPDDDLRPRASPGSRTAGSPCSRFADGAIGSLFVNEATHPLRSDAASVPMPGRLELEIHGPAARSATGPGTSSSSTSPGHRAGPSTGVPRDEMRPRDRRVPRRRPRAADRRRRRGRGPPRDRGRPGDLRVGADRPPGPGRRAVPGPDHRA